MQDKGFTVFRGIRNVLSGVRLRDIFRADARFDSPNLLGVTLPAANSVLAA